MIWFESEQTIDRSAEDVGAYAADLMQHPKWMAIQDVTIVRGAPGEVGTTFRETIKMGPRRYAAELVVSESVPAKALAWRVTGGAPLAGEARLDLEPLGSGRNRARWSGAFRLTGLWRVLGLVMAGEVRARTWYEEKLGLSPDREGEGGLWYRFGGETWLYLYATPSAGSAQNTIAGWTVTAIETVMSDLRERGVTFEDYDFGDFKSVDGLADFGTAKAAWFTDGEGNIYELSEVGA